MDRERRRRVLEAIALADDSTPGDRLRALTELREFERESLPRFALEAEATADEDLEEDLAALSAPVGGCVGILTDPSSALGSILADVLGPGVRYPDLAAAVRAEIERQAEQVAARRKDVVTFEARVESRARKLAAERLREIEALRATESFAAEQTTAGQGGAVASPGSGAQALPGAPERRALPPGIDPDAGWSCARDHGPFLRRILR